MRSEPDYSPPEEEEEEASPQQVAAETSSESSESEEEESQESDEEVTEEKLTEQFDRLKASVKPKEKPAPVSVRKAGSSTGVRGLPFLLVKLAE